MKINEITDGHSDPMQWLKSNRMHPMPEIDKALKSINPMKHDVMDEALRPKKVVKTDTGNGVVTRLEDVARIALGMQRLIVSRAVSFCFGNKTLVTSDASTEAETEAFRTFRRVLKAAKTDSLNRRLARTLFTFGEVAEYWYATGGGHMGASGDRKLRVSLFTPDTSSLYPFFDETGDMTAFSRSFTKKVGEDIRQYFETWTDEEYCRWDDKGAVEEQYRHNLGKIPVIYARQQKRETEDVDNLISRLETLLSNFADTDDYHASPKIVVNGEIKSFSKKGETGAIIEVDENTKPYYLSWDNAPQSVKLEIETLIKMIYTISQTPDVSFDNMKGVGAVSGTALRTLFTDAILKVQEHQEVLDEYLDRRTSVVKAYINALEPSTGRTLANLEIENQIIPYMSNDDDTSRINSLLNANGNKPLISHKQSVIDAALSKDPEADYRQLMEEESSDTFNDIAEPTI